DTDAEFARNDGRRNQPTAGHARNCLPFTVIDQAPGQRASITVQLLPGNPECLVLHVLFAPKRYIIGNRGCGGKGCNIFFYGWVRLAYLRQHSRRHKPPPLAYCAASNNKGLQPYSEASAMPVA